MKDGRVRYRPAERAALLDYGVRAFCLTSGNLTSREMAELFIRHRSRVWDNAASLGPALFSLSQAAMTQIDLD